MKQPINEVRRMQVLAGIINEEDHYDSPNAINARADAELENARKPLVGKKISVIRTLKRAGIEETLDGIIEDIKKSGNQLHMYIKLDNPDQTEGGDPIIYWSNDQQFKDPTGSSGIIYTGTTPQDTELLDVLKKRLF